MQHSVASLQFPTVRHQREGGREGEGEILSEVCMDEDCMLHLLSPLFFFLHPSLPPPLSPPYRLTDACLGHNSVDLTLDAFLSSLPLSPSYLSPHVSSPSFASIPSFPSSLRSHGRVVHLVCFQQGEVVREDKAVLDHLQSLPSVRELVIYEEWKEGGRARKTVDIRSDMGYALLWHEEEEVVEKDYQTLLALQGKLLVVKEEVEGEEGREEGL